MTDRIYVGDYGTQISLDVGVDISDQTACEILYMKPDGTTGTWTASLGSDNESVEYTTVSGDLDTSGRWKFQARVTTANGRWYGLICEQRIYTPLA